MIKNTYIDPHEITSNQKNMFRNIAEEFDIDNVIPQ